MALNLALVTQIVKLIPESLLAPLLKQYDRKANATRYTLRHHLLVLLFSHLGGADSVRDIANALTSLGEHDAKELGITELPSKSTISYQNRRLNPDFFKELYLALYRHFYPSTGLNEDTQRVYALDSTTISLCHQTFDWAKFRSTKGGIKLHTWLELRYAMPAFVAITNAKKSDSKMLDAFELPKKSWLVMDRGYLDYLMLNTLNRKDVYFVVRSKEHLTFDQVLDQVLDPQHPEVISDQLVEPTRTASLNKYSGDLRLVEVKDSQTGKSIQLLTNNTSVSASQIGQLYRSRWDVESFFKTIKQNLNIQTFLGTNENAVMSQVWAGLISMLLVKYITDQSKEKRVFSNQMCYLRVHLMTRASLYEILKWPLSRKKLKARNPDLPQNIQIPLPRSAMAQLYEPENSEKQPKKDPKATFSG